MVLEKTKPKKDEHQFCRELLESNDFTIKRLREQVLVYEKLIIELLQDKHVTEEVRQISSLEVDRIFHENEILRKQRNQLIGENVDLKMNKQEGKGTFQKEEEIFRALEKSESNPKKAKSDSTLKKAYVI